VGVSNFLRSFRRFENSRNVEVPPGTGTNALVGRQKRNDENGKLKREAGRLTLDIDGSVITTGSRVSWAFRGFNPHRRKDPSYYPILAHLAQSGHILGVKNRPGNVQDSKGAVAFVRELIDDVRMRLGDLCL
jgi:hypothetical protein